eukprot:TRINITY_DN6074_c0_g1_i1.p1 TRINITY_DN6074_c0_g1~~TRINITY_DN6074_c0_g1_i1.p1  ORF type:complete len:516 (-),score=82.13 TRINITY_DN6074_c0_g1_i1:193-1710(-)
MEKLADVRRRIERAIACNVRGDGAVEVTWMVLSGEYLTRLPVVPPLRTPLDPTPLWAAVRLLEVRQRSASEHMLVVAVVLGLTAPDLRLLLRVGAQPGLSGIGCVDSTSTCGEREGSRTLLEIAAAVGNCDALGVIMPAMADPTLSGTADQFVGDPEKGRGLLEVWRRAMYAAARMQHLDALTLLLEHLHAVTCHAAQCVFQCSASCAASSSVGDPAAVERNGRGGTATRGVGECKEQCPGCVCASSDGNQAPAESRPTWPPSPAAIISGIVASSAAYAYPVALCDLLVFLLGCSYTREHTILSAGVWEAVVGASDGVVAEEAVALLLRVEHTLERSSITCDSHLFTTEACDLTQSKVTASFSHTSSSCSSDGLGVHDSNRLPLELAASSLAEAKRKALAVAVKRGRVSICKRLVFAGAPLTHNGENLLLQDAYRMCPRWGQVPSALARAGLMSSDTISRAVSQRRIIAILEEATPPDALAENSDLERLRGEYDDQAVQMTCGIL